MEEIIKQRKGAPSGHPRYGGRRKGSLNKKTVEIKQLASQMGVDPVAYLCTIVGCDGALQIPVVEPETGKNVIDADGKPVLRWIAITTRQKLDACKELMPYIRPKLAATQLTGKDGGPIETATLDITQILADPELARNAQELALRMADQMDASDGPREPVPVDLYPKPIRGSR